MTSVGDADAFTQFIDSSSPFEGGLGTQAKPAREAATRADLS